MSLIKAAGRDRDVDRAFGIIQRLRENNAACHQLAQPGLGQPESQSRTPFEQI